MFKLKSFIEVKLKAHKELRYLISGAGSEVIEFVSFLILFRLTHLLILSNSLSFLLGISSGFVFHKLWSFAGKHRFKVRRQLVSYCFLAVFNFIMINVLVSFGVHQVKMLPAIAKLLGMIITAIWSFVFFNKFVFQHANDTSN